MKPDNEKAVYGFSLWLGTGVLLVVYLVWSLGHLPADCYFPHMYWSLGGTAVLAVTLTMYFALVNLMWAFRMVDADEWGAVTDRQAMRVRPNKPGGLPLVADIPVMEVTRMLYGGGGNAGQPRRRGGS